MDITNTADNTKMMDFETGIDTWVIDKEDSNESHASFEKSRREFNIQSFELKAMDKENIKQFIALPDRKVLRYYRICKHVGYQDSSESESEFKRKLSSDKDDSPSWNKKQRLESSQPSFFDKGFQKSKLHYASSTSSLSSSNEKLKDKECLSSEEISVMLSEIEGSSDSVQEQNRERLHSIENVSILVDNKDKSEDIAQSLKLSFNCSTCNCEYYSLEDLKSHEDIHKKLNFTKISQLSDQSMNQIKQTPNQLNSTASVWNKSDFLDSFKTHLINQGTFSGFNNNASCLSKDSKEEMRKPKKPSTENTKTFKCDICNYYCSELLIHKSHQILFHSQKKVLDCEYCDYKTSQCANLATHIRVHFQLDCPHCDYQCSLKSSLEAHLMRYHPNINHYKCKKCDYNCKSQNKFQKHLQLHTVTSKYQCGDCNMYFPSKQILKMHIKKHFVTKETFKCDKCELCFSRKHYLKLHMRSHKQLYICNTCNSKFSHKNYLKIHMKLHTQEALKCEKCNSIFTRKNYLKLHMRIHLPKFFKCQHCSFQSIDSNDLSKHICINKLYNVQKRSLHFQVEGSENNTDLNTNNINEETRQDQVDTEKRASRKLYKSRKHKKNRIKLLSLRQNLPSRKNQINVEDGNKNIELPIGLSSKYEEIKKVAKKRKYVKKAIHTIKRNGIFDIKQNVWVICKKENEITKLQNKPGKKIKKEQLSRGLDCLQLLFGKKQSVKDLLKEPVTFLSGSYVQCYYQSQQTPLVQDHLQRHVRQNTLLSCRFCKYKTNSQHLLQCHTTKHHTWDPAVINMLFR